MTPISENILMLNRARRVLADPDCVYGMSRGQVAAMAIVLNRPEYLQCIGMPLVQAFNRFEPHEIEAINFAANSL